MKDRYEATLELIKKHHTLNRKHSRIPYWVHPMNVAEKVHFFTKESYNSNIMIAALLHDILEDTKMTLRELQSIYSNNVCDLVNILTSNKEEIYSKNISKAEYLINKIEIMSIENKDALTIKLCDRLDNISTIQFVPQQFKENYIKETREIYNSITNIKTFSDIQKEIMSMIGVTLSCL
jgi:GTP pyrophosphokinase